MKVKTSVTLSPELIEAVDRCAGAAGRRSETLEQLAWAELRRRARDERSRIEIELLNKIADEMASRPADFPVPDDLAVPFWKLGSEFVDDAG